ncbi:MAG: type II toxin-antitoxin system RelE/ParE family toxin [Candidatus Bathyarchaeia archaeon]
MIFKVLLHPKAAKALQKLDAKNKLQIKTALGTLLTNPYESGEPMHPSDYWKIKAEDYRAIYEIDSAKQEVIVLFIGHRRNMYDDFSKIL